MTRLVASGITVLLMGTLAAQSHTGLPITYERLLKATQEPGNWLTYSGDYRSHHYSTLDQITADNVHRLRAKWIYQMHKSKVETTPIVVDGVMYVTRPPSDVIALDAETGRALWTFEYRLPSRVYTCCGAVNRGLAILGRTLFVTTLDARLIALDADTGTLKWHFQFTPHDTRDWNATQVPVLLDFTIEGRPRKLVIVPSRNGFYHVLDRQTGEFLLAKPFARQTWAKHISTRRDGPC